MSLPSWLCLSVLVSAAVPGWGSLRIRAAEAHSKSSRIRPQCRTHNRWRTVFSPLLLLSLTLLDTAEERQRSLVKEKMHLRLLTAQEVPSCLCDPVKPAEERAALCRQCGTLSRLSYLFHYSAKNPSPYFAGGRLPTLGKKSAAAPTTAQPRLKSALLL